MNYSTFFETVWSLKRSSEARIHKMENDPGRRDISYIQYTTKERIRIRTYEGILDAAGVLKQADVFNMDAMGQWIQSQNYERAAKRAVVELVDMIKPMLEKEGN